jgi:hypothetical protein
MSPFLITKIPIWFHITHMPLLATSATTARSIFKFAFFTDQYDSKNHNGSIFPLCSDPSKVSSIQKTERDALISSNQVNYHCPLPCVNNEFHGLVTSYQSGQIL